MIVGAIVASGVTIQQVLVVEGEDGTELLVVPVEDNATVVLEYTHSVEKTPVRDIYTVDEGGLRMTRMEFSSFGAGLPSNADVERTTNGSFVYEPSRARTDELLVATGHVAGHQLVVEDERYDLVAMADAGTVRITVTTRLDL